MLRSSQPAEACLWLVAGFFNGRSVAAFASGVVHVLDCHGLCFFLTAARRAPNKSPALGCSNKNFVCKPWPFSLHGSTLPSFWSHCVSKPLPFLCRGTSPCCLLLRMVLKYYQVRSYLTFFFALRPRPKCMSCSDSLTLSILSQFSFFTIPFSFPWLAFSMTERHTQRGQIEFEAPFERFCC